MNPTRYNLALNKAKDNYNQRAREQKHNNKEERRKIQDLNKRSIDTLRDHHKTEKNEIIDTFNKKIEEQRSHFNELLKKQEYDSNQNLNLETASNLKDRQRIKLDFEESLNKTRLSHATSMNKHPYIDKSESLKKALKKKDHVYTNNLNTIKDDNHLKVKELHDHFIDTKRKLVSETGQKMKQSLEKIRSKYTRDDDIKTEAYEKRLNQKLKENETLQTDYQKKVKDLKKKFSIEIVDQRKTNAADMDKERRSMRKLLVDKDRNQESRLEKLKDDFQVKIYQLNSKNDNRLKELEKRYQDQIKTIQSSHGKEVKSKTRRNRLQSEGIKKSHDVALENQKDYYENKMKILQTNLKEANTEIKLASSSNKV